MPLLLRKIASPSAIDCDAVEKRIRNSDPSVTEAEYAACWKRDAERQRDIISRSSVAQILGVTVRTLFNWHRQNYGPKRLLRSQSRYGYSRTEVEAWVAQHGKGSRPKTPNSAAPASIHEP